MGLAGGLQQGLQGLGAGGRMGLAGFPNTSAAPQQGPFHGGGLAAAGAAGLAAQQSLRFMGPGVPLGGGQLPGQFPSGINAAAAAQRAQGLGQGLGAAGAGVPASHALFGPRPGGFADGTGSAVTSPDGDKGPGAAGVGHPWLLKYGLLGLLHIIRMSEPDLTMLALGTDLTGLGLNLNSADSLYKVLVSPLADTPVRADLDFEVPACYKHNPPRLQPGYLAKFKEETLFYIFYSMPQ
eukprot:gene3106-3384_t